MSSYAASSGNFLPTFRGTMPIVCLETSVINYHYSSRNNTEEYSSNLLPDSCV
jgi:hypothetical protein